MGFTVAHVGPAPERERAVAAFAHVLAQRPASIGADDIAPLRAAGLSEAEMLDVLNAAAIFDWANRLTHNLGEPVRPEPG